MKQNLLWIDLEMTGLDPDKDKIIEIAAIITDWNFKELAVYEAVVKQPATLLKQMDAWNQRQHAASGLLPKIAGGKSPKTVETELLKLLDKHFDRPITLAGNSIHHDRRFIRRAWPKLEKRLHYRMLDVSAWKVVMMGKYDIEFRKSESHRALEDIRGSIEELKQYLDKFSLSHE